MQATNIDKIIEQKVQEVNDRKMRPIMEQITVETARIKAAEKNISELKKQAADVRAEQIELAKNLTEAFTAAQNVPGETA